MTASDPPADARMEPIATLPVFLKLRGKRALLAGGSAPAVWKAELLSAAGASVEVFATAVVPEMADLVAAPPGGPIALVRRDWTDADLPGAAIALGAIEDDADAAIFQAAARRAGVPVNVIDKPVFCDFQFGTIVSRSPLLIGISTDGAAPVFGQAIRARIEALLPQALRRWAEAARDWRPATQALRLDFRGRRRFWEVFAKRALEAPNAEPEQADFAACAEAALSAAADADVARVTLVGSGPGDPDLVTLKAVRALQAADIIIVSEDVSPVVVGYARRESVKARLDTGSDEAEATAQVVARATPGRRLVWLGPGDPALCRVWEERLAALSAAGIHVDLADGIGRCACCDARCPAWGRDR